MSNPHDPTRHAVISLPSSSQMGGEGPAPFVRFPFYPTAPWYSTNPNVGYQVRFYSTGVQSTDTDYVVGSEITRSVQFDLPCRVIAINGALVDTSDFTRFTQQNMNLGYLFRVEYTTGDKLHVNPRLASTVVGTMDNPGELGGHGYNVDQGATLQCSFTPLVNPANPQAGRIRIDITFVCLEMRGPRNFSVSG